MYGFGVSGVTASPASPGFPVVFVIEGLYNSSWTLSPKGMAASCKQLCRSPETSFLIYPAAWGLLYWSEITRFTKPAVMANLYEVLPTGLHFREVPSVALASQFAMEPARV